MTPSAKAPRPPSHSSETALRGLRANCFAGLVMLLFELGLGVAANLTAKLPATNTGRSLPAAFGAAITGGPVVLSVHAVLGTLLLATGVAAALAMFAYALVLFVAPAAASLGKAAS